MNYEAVFFLLLYLHSIEAVFNCSSINQSINRSNCLCLGGENPEIQCPDPLKPHFGELSDPVVTININEKRDGAEKETTIKINCSYANESLLPNLRMQGIDFIQMKECLLPNNFKEVLAKLSTDQVKIFQFGEINLTGLTLTKEYFAGLDSMEDLRLPDLKLSHLDEDVFANTPNLKFLELQQNRIVLTANLFKHTPRLIQLDLSRNNIDSIPYGTFEPLKDLKSLHLWDNKLTKLEDFTFLGLNKVVTLELLRNNIETIDETAFVNLTQLKQINLSFNKLTALPPLLFANNRKLKLVGLSWNLKLVLPERLMANLPELQEVLLEHMELEYIPGNLFENSTNLRKLNLNHNKLISLPELFLEDAQNVEEINLSHNNLTNVTDRFSSLKSLARLSLTENQITELEETALEGTNNLVKIDLSFNKLEKIHNKVFDGKSKLKTINLAHNLLGKSELNYKGPILMNALAVEDLNLSFNLISQVEHVIEIYNLVYLTNLDLSHNQITNILVSEFQPMSKNLQLNLANNNITFVNFTYAAQIADGQSQDTVKMHLDDNPIDCDCFSEDLVKYFKNTIDRRVKLVFDISPNNVLCASPPFLKGQPVQKLDSMDLTCPLETKCPDECSCLWRPAESAIVINCTGQNLTEWPAIHTAVNQTFSFNETVLYLDHNLLSEGPSGKLDGYKDITKLYLAHNRIKELAWIPPKLKVLDIRYNALENIDYKVLKALNTSTFRRLLLSNNPWECQCQIHNLTNFLRHSTQKVDTKDVYCYNSTKKVIDLDQNSICPRWLDMYTAFVVLLFLLLVAISVAIYYKHRKDILAWLYVNNYCLWCFKLRTGDFDEDKPYDAFISYSSKDEDFVRQNLIPVLEGGPEPFKLCVDYRNFVPGEIITKQITNSILDSKRTLVILSKYFIESVWTKMEFRTAHTQAMTDGRARVIVIIYGDIDMDSLSKELKLYLKHTNYLKWGEPFFWNRLKYALPHRKVSKGAGDQKHANMMAYIDDKFNLVPTSVVSTNPASTPPILDTKDLSVKKEPLIFVPNLELNTPAAESGTLLTTANT